MTVQIPLLRTQNTSHLSQKTSVVLRVQAEQKSPSPSSRGNYRKSLTNNFFLLRILVNTDGFMPKFIIWHLPSIVTASGSVNDGIEKIMACTYLEGLCGSGRARSVLLLPSVSIFH